jgi:rhodanese-related sulfurtransferase
MVRGCRRLGDKTLHFLCGLSENPESCVLKATASFAKHRVRTLLISKFVAGLDAVAAPLAGAARIPAIQFLALDGLGALFWSSTFVALGYIFSNQLERVAAHLLRIGALVGLTIAAAFIFHLIKRVARWQRFVRQFKLTGITPEELRDKLKVGEDILLVDLQGGLHYTTGPMAIPGAVRIDPHRLEQYGDVEIVPSQEVVLYCACPGELTSARVALALQRKGIEHVRPLAGGIQAWRDRGFPVTSEVRVPANRAVRG